MGSGKDDEKGEDGRLKRGTITAGEVGQTNENKRRIEFFNVLNIKRGNKQCVPLSTAPYLHATVDIITLRAIFITRSTRVSLLLMLCQIFSLHAPKPRVRRNGKIYLIL